MMEHGSDVARLRQRIALEYEAAMRGLTGLAITAPHEFITARMERIADCHQELQALVGEPAAIQVVAQALERAGGESET
jgi:hypothetical protein